MHSSSEFEFNDFNQEAISRWWWLEIKTVGGAWQGHIKSCGRCFPLAEHGRKTYDVDQRATEKCIENTIAVPPVNTYTVQECKIKEEILTQRKTKHVH